MATLTPRNGILNIKPHMLAAPLHNETQALVNLSSNESALGPSPKAAAAAQQALKTVERYPDDGPGDLAAAIGAAMALDPLRTNQLSDPKEVGRTVSVSRSVLRFIKI
jgi:histidinol-phosphate aminotransferase